MAAHTAVLCVTYFSRINDPQYKAMRQKHVEISYNPAYKRPVDIREYPIRPAQRLDFRTNPKLLSNGSIGVSLVKDRQNLPFGMLFERKPDHMQAMELSHKMFMTPINSEKINNPVYAAYQNMVRDRIKQKIYMNADRMESGSVELTFLIGADGELKDAKIIPEKTNASEHLQGIAMRSLQEASPFPAFLKGMNQPEYPLSIEVQYQVSDD